MSVRVVGCRVPAEIRRFVAWLGEQTEIRHGVVVEIVPDTLQGVCLVPGVPGPLPYILVTLGRSLAQTLDSIAHEFVHYEQWRDGRAMNERGVKQRAAALVQRYQREAA